MFIMVRSFPPTGSWPEALAWLCHKNSIGERKEKIMQKFPMQSVNCMGNFCGAKFRPSETGASASCFIAAAGARPGALGSPGPRRRKVRLAPFPPAAKTAPAPLLLRSPPNPRLTPLGFGGDPDWGGHAAPGGRAVLRRLMQALIAAAATHPEVPGSPGPAWPGRTAPGCCSWCKPSSLRPRLCRGCCFLHPGCSLP